ncbi:MAG: DUF3052 domain-containing protein, partial [Bacteroidota bacterium]
MAGYSGTPLHKKLGLKTDFKACVINAPENYYELLGDTAPVVRWVSSRAKDLDFVHLFAVQAKTLEKQLPKLQHKIRKNGMIWVSWYKKSAKMPTDLNEDIIRGLALSLGLVDVKVCAVD